MKKGNGPKVHRHLVTRGENPSIIHHCPTADHPYVALLAIEKNNFYSIVIFTLFNGPFLNSWVSKGEEGYPELRGVIIEELSKLKETPRTFYPDLYKKFVGKFTTKYFNFSDVKGGHDLVNRTQAKNELSLESLMIKDITVENAIRAYNDYLKSLQIIQGLESQIEHPEKWGEGDKKLKKLFLQSSIKRFVYRADLMQRLADEKKRLELSLDTALLYTRNASIADMYTDKRIIMVRESF